LLRKHNKFHAIKKHSTGVPLNLIEVVKIICVVVLVKSRYSKSKHTMYWL